MRITLFRRRSLFWILAAAAVLAGSLLIPRLQSPLPLISTKIRQAREHPFTSLFQDYLRIHTEQPRGNTYEAAVFFAMILHEHGMDAEIFEAAPGKANLVAVLQGGKGTEPPLILHHHMDTAEIYRPDLWKYDPWGGVIWGPYLYGLGAIDMKSYGICFLDAFIKAHDEHWPLNRTIIYYGSCAEEADFEAGSRWMLKAHPEFFPRGAVYLSEGGMVELTAGLNRFVGIEVGQKAYARFHTRVTKEQKAALDPLLKAVVPRAADVHPEVRELLRNLYPFRIAPYRHCLLDVDPCVAGKTFDEVRIPHYLKELLFTRPYWMDLGDGSTVLHIGALWGEPIQAYADRAAGILRDQGIPFTMTVTPVARITVSDTPEFKGVARVYQEEFPGIPVFPYLQGSALTEASLFRERGLLCYGVVPVRYTIFDSINMNLFDECIYLPYLLEGYDLAESWVRALAVRH